MNNLEEKLKIAFGRNKSRVTEETTKENKNYLKLTYKYARENSHDNSTWVGFSTIPQQENESPIYGTNKIPGYESKEDIPTAFLERPLKYDKVKHAEENLQTNVELSGDTLENKTVIGTWSPCRDKCSVVLANEKITKLIVHLDTVILTPEDWLSDLHDGQEYMLNKGIKIGYYSGPVDEPARMREKDYIA